VASNLISGEVPASSVALQSFHVDVAEQSGCFTAANQWLKLRLCRDIRLRQFSDRDLCRTPAVLTTCGRVVRRGMPRGTDISRRMVATGSKYQRCCVLLLNVVFVVKTACSLT